MKNNKNISSQQRAVLFSTSLPLLGTWSVAVHFRKYESCIFIFWDLSCSIFTFLLAEKKIRHFFVFPFSSQIILANCFHLVKKIYFVWIKFSFIHYYIIYFFNFYMRKIFFYCKYIFLYNFYFKKFLLLCESLRISTWHYISITVIFFFLHLKYY